MLDFTEVQFLKQECFQINSGLEVPSLPAKLYKTSTERFCSNLPFLEIATLPFFKTIKKSSLQSQSSNLSLYLEKKGQFQPKYTQLC